MPRWLRVLREIFGARWVVRSGNHDEDLPDYAGWYRVMVSGDSEQIDGHTIYDFDDYETWAFFTPHEDGGNFYSERDEADNDTVFAWCGPFNPPAYKETFR